MTQGGGREGKRETMTILDSYYIIQYRLYVLRNIHFNLKYIANTCMTLCSHPYHPDIIHCVFLPFMCLNKMQILIFLAPALSH